jgi:hypothetical protein
VENHKIWLASLDRRSAPRQITAGGAEVSFGAHGTLVFRLVEKNASILYRMSRDGSERVRITDTPITRKFSVSPDGEWVIACTWGPVVGADVSSDTLSVQTVATIAVPVRGGAARKICGAQQCPATWSSDGRLFYVSFPFSTEGLAGKTLAIPVPAGKSLPDLAPSGIAVPGDIVEIPHAQVIDKFYLSPGPDPSTYVFRKSDLQRNLFRIPLR